MTCWGAHAALGSQYSSNMCSLVRKSITAVVLDVQAWDVNSIRAVSSCVCRLRLGSAHFEARPRGELRLFIER